MQFEVTTAKKYTLTVRYPDGLEAHMSQLDEPICEAAARALLASLSDEARARVCLPHIDWQAVRETDTIRDARDAIRAAGYDPDLVSAAEAIRELYEERDEAQRELSVLDQFAAIVRHGPTFPGDTIGHSLAEKLAERGWIRRDEDGNWVEASPLRTDLEVANARLKCADEEQEKRVERAEWQLMRAEAAVEAMRPVWEAGYGWVRDKVRAEKVCRAQRQTEEQAAEALAAYDAAKTTGAASAGTGGGTGKAPSLQDDPNDSAAAIARDALITNPSLGEISVAPVAARIRGLESRAERRGRVEELRWVENLRAVHTAAEVTERIEKRLSEIEGKVDR